MLLRGVARAGGHHQRRRWERGWCSPCSQNTAANTDFSSCVCRERQISKKCCLVRWCRSARRKLFLGGSGVVAGWTVAVTQDTGKGGCRSSVFSTTLLSCSETCCRVSLQVHAAYASRSSGLFELARARGMWEITTCSPKISSGTDFLCFVCRNVSAWTGGVGCWPVLFSCVLVWCTEITLISSFLS